MEPQRLRIDRLIVHDIPKKDSGEQPRLSESARPVDPSLLNTFKLKISDSLKLAANDVAFIPNCESCVPKLVLDQLGESPSDFVEVSQAIAKRLFECQTSRNTAGFLTVVHGNVESKPALVILKLEKEKGVRIEPQIVEGKLTYDFEEISMTLGTNTKVFKIGFFVQTGTTLDSIVGSASDTQRSTQSIARVAGFFLRSFLGCDYREAPAVTTMRFYQASERYINEEVTDPLKRKRYEFALQATLDSQRSVFSPKEFAEEHLDGDDIDYYLRFLEDANVPLQQIPKNISLIEKHLRKMQFNFERGTILIASKEEVNENIEFTSLDGNSMRVSFQDRLDKVKGKI